MTSKTKITRVSMIALAAASILVVRPGFAHATATAAQLQAEINELQAQINALSTQQDAVNAQVADNAIAMKKLATSTKSTAGGWHAADNDSAIPDFKNDKGSEFTIFGQVEVDAGLAGIQQKDPAKNIQGYQGAANFRRVEFGIRGVFDNNFPYVVQEDWTKTGSPLSGLLDVWLGYSFKSPYATSTIFRLGNQHTPFGFQTPSSSTFDMENDVGNTLFQDGRLLGLTGQTYNKHFNFWYGLMSTGVGGSGCSAVTGSDTIVPGSCYQPGSTTSTALTASQFTGAYDLAYNVWNTPGYLLSIRNSNEYNHYNGSLENPNNDPTLKSGPDLNITGETFITTGALPAKSMFVESPRIDYEYGPLTLAAVYYRGQISSNALAPGLHVHESPTFSSWDVEGQLFLTPGDHEIYATDQGYYGSVKVAHPVTDGGPGALQINARVDEANLSAARYGVYGGDMTNVTLGLTYLPVSAIRIDLNYVHTLPIGGAQAGTLARPVYTNAYRGRSADSVGMRFEVIY